MHSSLVQTLITHLDTLLTLALCAIFLRPNLRKSYPWMASYLCVRSVTAVAVEFLLFGPLLGSASLYYKIYFVVHWSSYLVSAVMLFMVCLDVYRQAMAPLPGLARMGTTIFRWASIASILVTATSLTAITSSVHLLVQFSTQLMRCVGTVELCLLAFLALSMNAIGLSPRSRPFGIALGFGILAANDCAMSFLGSYMVELNSPLQALFEGIAVACLGLWTVYALLPEQSRKPVALPVRSAIYRWNDIISAIGPREPHVVLQQTQRTFLVDVEEMVERVIVRNQRGKESET